MATQYYQSVDAGVLRTKPASRSALFLFFFYIHISGGLVGMLIGPIQFISAWRKRYPKLHRWLGTAYFAGIFSSRIEEQRLMSHQPRAMVINHPSEPTSGLAIAGLIIAPFAMGGSIAQTGFFVLGWVWLAVTGMGLRTLLRGQYQAHRQWMIRSYALTFAAVTLRIWLPLLQFALGLDFITAYMIVAWLCWVPNLTWAEWKVRLKVPYH